MANTLSSQKNDSSDELTLDQLMSDYRDVSLMLDALWPLEPTNERIAARMLKITEEVGELSNEVLTKMGLQRQAKVDAFKESHLEDELADVLGSVLLLAVELEIDVKAIMSKKLAFTVERLQQELEAGV